MALVLLNVLCVDAAVSPKSMTMVSSVSMSCDLVVFGVICFAFLVFDVLRSTLVVSCEAEGDDARLLGVSFGGWSARSNVTSIALFVTVSRTKCCDACELDSRCQ